MELCNNSRSPELWDPLAKSKLYKTKNFELGIEDPVTHTTERGEPVQIMIFS